MGYESTYVQAFRRKQSNLVEAMEYHDKISKIRDAMQSIEELVENEIAQGKVIIIIIVSLFGQAKYSTFSVYI